jgi:transcriptional regulator with XRE-family HTH domain
MINTAMNMPNHSTAHQELGNFLAARRRQLTPEDVGLPITARRRTPGLRREEVALLASISPTWYTKLEQGKPIGVSSQVIHGIARALQLNDAQERHLLTLAGLPAPELSAPSHDVAPELRNIIDQLNPFPSFVINSHWDLLGWNRAAGQVYQFDRLPPADRNILVFLFTNSAHRQRLVGWEQEAQAAVARFRTSTVYFMGEVWLSDMVNRLLAQSPEFARLWQTYDIQDEHSNPKVLQDARYGRLSLQQTTLTSPHLTGLQCVVQCPTDDSSRAALAALSSMQD